MATTLGFYGAAQTVTGSRHLLTTEGKTILIDCGLFQGGRELRDLNWADFHVHPAEIDAVVITHAHADHIGWLPRLVKQGYQGPIYATQSTISLSRIALPDSGRLHEEEARYANKHGNRHGVALPLSTEQDAYAALKLFKKVAFHEWHELPGKAQFRYHHAGHILGSAFAEITLANGTNILMSGDLGRYNTPIIRDPEVMTHADYLVVESTYGDRLHPIEDPLDKLEMVLNDAMSSGSAVLIPSFAIGRTQELLYYFRQLQDTGRMPRIPIFIDSPMAVSVTQAYAQGLEDHDEEMRISIASGKSELEPIGVQLIRDREQSKELNNHPGPLVIVSGSGMANGGRITHHLLRRLSNPATIVLFTGYQASGTLGRKLIDGEPTVHIFGQEVTVNARIEKMNALSAHADQGEILHWLGGFKVAPKKTFIVHGEPPAQEALEAKIVSDLGWNVTIPTHGQEFQLD